ncbi:hypothetical protein LguiA_004655 [Lonicera macranthoides]
MKKCHEINGIEGVCGYNPEHGERGGSQYYGVGEENTWVSARAVCLERIGSSDASSTQTNDELYGKMKNMSIRLKNGKSVRARPSVTFTTEGARSQ